MATKQSLKCSSHDGYVCFYKKNQKRKIKGHNLDSVTGLEMYVAHLFNTLAMQCYHSKLDLNVSNLFVKSHFPAAIKTIRGSV